MSEQNVEPSEESFRLSPQQEMILQLAAGAVPRVQLAVVVPVAVAENELRAALDAVVRRHEILRTTLVRRSGMLLPSQVIRDRVDAAWTARGLDESAVDAVLREEREAELDLERGPVLRALLGRVGGEKQLLVLTAGAVCVDAASLAIVERELLQVARGADAEAAGDPLQYADYAEWRHELLSSDDAAQGAAFWSELETPTPAPPLLFGRRPDADGASATEIESFEVPRDALATFGQGTLDPAFLEAAWHGLIARLTAEQDVLVASTLDGRTAEELEDAVGSFAGPVPIATRIEEATSFAEVVDQVSRGRAEAQQWFDYEPSDVALALCASAAPGFRYVDLEPGDSARVEAVFEDLLGCPIELRLVAGAGDLAVQLAHDPATYTAQDAETIAQAYVELLTAAAGDPSRLVDELGIQAEAERGRLLEEAAGIATAVPEACVHHLFEERAGSTPDRVALVGGGMSTSYGELNAHANRIAHLLRSRGVAPNAAVGLCMDRSPVMIASLLGILKAGGAYLPLNFEHPSSRLAHQLKEAGATVALSQELYAEKLSDFAGDVVCVDGDAAALESQPSDDPERINSADDLVYVMYTSGSTGQPKGVAVTHGNLSNYTAHIARTLRLDAENDLSFAAVTAISTDLGNTCIFPALATGGILHLVSPETSMDGALLRTYVQEHSIDVLKITPSHLAALLVADPEGSVLPRHWLIVGGEAFPWALAQQVLAIGSCCVFNHYGPTETTVGSCMFPVTSDGAEGRPASVPIGRPIANTTAYVLDRRGEPVLRGVPGELWIGGAGVSNGYVGQPEQTAASFADDPFTSTGRMYRTGDRARLLPDGNIEFLGRADDQVKIRGFRVEPGEIEAALQRHSAVRQSAVVAHIDGRNESRLVAYVVATPPTSSDELRTFLLQSLPDVMVPSQFLQLDALPFTASGKVDRRALPDPETVRAAGDFVEPRTQLEEQLAAIWSDVLGIQRVGATDDFFELGGHSLLATQVVARVRSGLGVELPLHTIFVSPTIERLAEAVLALQGSGDDEEMGELLAELESLSDDDVREALSRDEGAS